VVRALLEEGSAARAYLLKERVSDPEQVVGAIDEVDRGGSVIDPKVVEALVADDRVAPARAMPVANLAEPLTERELEVLGLMVSGASSQDIARQLVVSLATVKTHVNHIFGKRGAESRVQVASRACGLGLVWPTRLRVEV